MEKEMSGLQSTRYWQDGNDWTGIQQLLDVLIPYCSLYRLPWSTFFFVRCATPAISGPRGQCTITVNHGLPIFFLCFSYYTFCHPWTWPAFGELFTEKRTITLFLWEEGRHPLVDVKSENKSCRCPIYWKVLCFKPTVPTGLLFPVAFLYP